jgi:hypothetical protein
MLPRNEREGESVMATGILIIGNSGHGKSTSFRNLNPAETLIINSDKKPLPWRGWKKQYSAENKNYIVCDDAHKIQGYLKHISEKMPHIKVAIIDTLNGAMLAQEMAERKTNSFDAWRDLATSIYGIMDMIGTLREDLTVICTAHSQTEMTDGGYQFTHMKTSGRKLEKIVPESKFTVVLLARANEGKYVFEVHAKNSTAKTPLGLFEEDEIENDIVLVLEKLKEYEEG